MNTPDFCQWDKRLWHSTTPQRQAARSYLRWKEFGRDVLKRASSSLQVPGHSRPSVADSKSHISTGKRLRGQHGVVRGLILCVQVHALSLNVHKRSFKKAELEKGYNLYYKSFQEFKLPLCSFLPIYRLAPPLWSHQVIVVSMLHFGNLTAVQAGKKIWYNPRTHTGSAFSTAELMNWKPSREDCSSPHPQLLERLSCLYEIHTNSERFSEKISNFKEQINSLFSNTKKI